MESSIGHSGCQVAAIRKLSSFADREMLSRDKRDTSAMLRTKENAFFGCYCRLEETKEMTPVGFEPTPEDNGLNVAP